MINREVKYERTVTGSYMKIPVGIQAGLDEKLMLKRKLQGTLPVEKTYVDGIGQYWYNISGKQSLDTYCRVKQIGISFVEKLVVSICSELEVMEWSLMDTACLMLDPELIFITNANQELIFTLYPGSSARIETEFQQLMEYMLTKIDHKDDAAVRAAYGIYERTLEASYSIMDIRETIMRAKQQEIAEAAEHRLELEGRGSGRERIANRSADIREGRETSRKSETRQNADKRRKGDVGRKSEIGRSTDKKRKRDAGRKSEIGRSTDKRRKGDASPLHTILEYVKSQLGFVDEKPASYADTKARGISKRNTAAEYEKDSCLIYPEEEVYEPQEEIHPTVCLSNYVGTPRGILVYQGFEQLKDIPLEAQITRIGYGKEADVRIEQGTVSQMHARIDRDGDDYYIEDLNSTNGTYVNDELLAYKERRQLKMNDIVCFANLKYRFC